MKLTENLSICLAFVESIEMAGNHLVITMSSGQEIRLQNDKDLDVRKIYAVIEVRL